ncbi:MAG: Gfo/Idh/MocA family oxidoreductase [Ferruginibacter sp.]
MQKINWGIIGCGDVTEVKSGPAFNKVSDSSLVAVMRRDSDKAKDYASRHQVPKWYDDANLLINDPDVNAIYVATPPSSHEAYTLAAFEAGKPVYVEKPMSMNHDAALNMANAAAANNIKLSVAHYRRGWPLFKQVKQWLDEKLIGQPLFVRLDCHKMKLTQEELQTTKTAWRIDPAIAGGGLFNDLSPHQLDIMYHLFGPVEKVVGVATNQLNEYAADDMVAGNILFRSGVVFSGTWCFNVSAGHDKEWCEITGTKGSIGFSFFEIKPVIVTVDGITRSVSFEPMQHVQQPMIEKVVAYFLDKGPNPCSGADGTEVMRLIDKFTAR